MNTSPVKALVKKTFRECQTLYQFIQAHPRLPPLALCPLCLYSSPCESKIRGLRPGAAAELQWIRELMMDDRRVCVHVCVQEDCPCIILSDTLPAVRRSGMMMDRGKRLTACMLYLSHTHTHKIAV